MFNVTKKSIQWGNETLTLETGKVARQADGSVIATLGETQVMAMDLAGFAVSAGSACSSGKVRASRVLTAMGFDEARAAQAIRVSIGPGVTKDDVQRFAKAWTAAYAKARTRAA